MFVLEISQYFYHKRNKGNKQEGRQETLELDHGYGIKTRSLYRKLTNIIENQINIYISSLFTCPVIWEQKRPIHFSRHPQECTMPLISPCLCAIVGPLASVYFAAISRKLWWREQPNLIGCYCPRKMF